TTLTSDSTMPIAWDGGSVCPATGPGFPGSASDRSDRIRCRHHSPSACGSSSASPSISGARGESPSTTARTSCHSTTASSEPDRSCWIVRADYGGSRHPRCRDMTRHEVGGGAGERWAVILGASTGTGAGIARAVARDPGLHVFGVHRGHYPDEARTLENEIRAQGRRVSLHVADA